MGHWLVLSAWFCITVKGKRQATLLFKLGSRCGSSKNKTKKQSKGNDNQRINSSKFSTRCNWWGIWKHKGLGMLLPAGNFPLLSSAGYMSIGHASHFLMHYWQLVPIDFPLIEFLKGCHWQYPLREENMWCRGLRGGFQSCEATCTTTNLLYTSPPRYNRSMLL